MNERVHVLASLLAAGDRYARGSLAAALGRPELDVAYWLPDDDRWWISFGAQYKYSPQLKFDAGFTYIDSKNASISQNAGNTATFGLLQGNYDAYTTIFSLQGAYTF